VLVIRNPDAAHHLGLADIQRRDPLDNLLPVRCFLQHPAPPTLSQQNSRRLPAGTAKGNGGI
jgi:hypothetical protein